MSKFNKKASKGTGGSDVDWDAYNDHLLEQIGDEVENHVAIVSGLIDLGVQERPDYVEEYTGTKKQEKAIKDGRSYVRENEDGEEEIVTELKPVDQVAIFADFPEIMINYGKFFSKDGEDDWKPYRHLITGTFWNKADRKMYAKGVSLSCSPNDKAKGGWAYDPKSTISKLAVATGSAKSPVEQDFDIGELLGGVFSMDLVAEESKDGKHINIKANNPSKKHKTVKVPEYDIEPMGIMLDGDNDEEDLKQLRPAIINTLELAEGWATSGLKEELDNLKDSSSEKKGSDDQEEEEDDTNAADEMPDLDDMDDEDILELAEELGMRVTTRTKVSRAISFIEDHYEGNEEEEDEEEEPPKKRSVSRSKKSNTKPQEEEEDGSEDDTDDEDPPF